MANNNNIPGLISTTNPQILAAGLKLPAGFNDSRSTNELQSLFLNKNNSTTIYNKFSQKTGSQPFITSKIGTTKGYLGWAATDIVRISKFSVSGTGLKFAGMQLLLQGLNAFNETKLYNPLMPIVGTTSQASFGLIDAPTRFIEPSVTGLLAATGLGFVSDALGLKKPAAPKGTVGASALPATAGDGGKGLIRGATATNADKLFTSKWGTPTASSLLSKVGNFFKANTALGTFLPVSQPSGTTYKVGEKSYGIFLSDKKNGLFLMPTFVGKGDWEVDGSTTLNQQWVGGKGIGGIEDGEYSISIGQYAINKNNALGYDSELPYSEVLQQYSSSYLNAPDSTLRTPSRPVDSRFQDNNDSRTIAMRDSLNSLLNKVNIKNDAAGKAGYTISDSITTVALSYKELIGVKSSTDIGKSPANYDGNSSTKLRGYQKIIQQYANSLPSEDALSAGALRTYLPNIGIDTYKEDNINLKGIVDTANFNTIANPNDNATKDAIAAHEPTYYHPYEEDLIAFYFHDVVNDKYIPFRATVKGIQENLAASWEEIKYINRADKLYTYGGFTRTLNFNFSIVITSIKELLPTWKRINYLTSLTKPANYTNGTIFSRFIVPPIIEFTIGDMYKNQPALITQVGLTIPDDASWELLSEEYAKNNDWSALAGKISWKDSKGKFAQFPNQCEITLQLNLLEKELPHTGGSNYGDYYQSTDMYTVLGSSGDGSFSKQLYTPIKHADISGAPASTPISDTTTSTETTSTIA